MDRVPKSLIAAHVATVALVIAMVLYVFLSVVPRIQEQRVSARRDSCNLIVGLARAATSSQPKARAGAEAFIHRTPLNNCNLYAQEDK